MKFKFFHSPCCPHFSFYLDYFPASLLRQHEIVHFQKSLFQGLLILPPSVICICFQGFDKVPFREHCNFGPYVQKKIPPWPSNTPKTEFLDESLMGDWEMWPSSMYYLHPRWWIMYRTWMRQRRRDLYQLWLQQTSGGQAWIDMNPCKSKEYKNCHN